MKKTLKLLHRKLDITMDKNMVIKEQHKKMKKLFKEEGIEYESKNDFAYFINEIIYHGILNKKAIENAYYEGLARMAEYFEALDYRDRKRLMNYELEECLNSLIHFEYDSQNIFIPFFDKKLNALYEKEMVLFSLKQYHRLIKDYQDLFLSDRYSLIKFKSSFSSLSYVYGDEKECSFYDSELSRLYFLKDMIYEEFITIPKIEQLDLLSIAYFNDQHEEFINILDTTSSVNQKIIKKLRK